MQNVEIIKTDISCNKLLSLISYTQLTQSHKMIISVSTIGTVVGIATPLHEYYLCVGYYQQSWVIIIDMWET